MSTAVQSIEPVPLLLLLLSDISRYMRRGKVGRPRKGTRITPLRQTGGAHGPGRAGRLGIRRFRLSDVTREHAEDIAQYGASRMRYHIERRGLVDTGTLLSSVFGIVDRITGKALRVLQLD